MSGSSVTFAVVKDQAVVDLIAASPETDEAALRLFFPESDDIVRETSETGRPFIDGLFIRGKFFPPSPYPSWTWSDEDLAWTPPTPKPPDRDGTFAVWDEDTLQWVLLPTEEPAPE